MKELFKEMIAMLFHIETYKDLAEYLMHENQKLEKELNDIKEYVKLISTDIEELDLEEVVNEVNESTI